MVGLIIDQWSKIWVASRFALGQSYNIIPAFFDITYVRNRGAAFSLLNDANPSFRDPFFLIMPLVVLGMLSVLFYRLSSEKKWAIFSVSLIMTGAIGNLIDRVRVGYVIDFLHFHIQDRYHYPMFNVADSCIVVGAILSLFFLRKTS